MELKSFINCPKCNGKGEICTYRGYINSSENIYDTCPECQGKKGKIIYLDRIPEVKALVKKIEDKNKLINILLMCAEGTEIYDDMLKFKKSFE